MSPKLIAGLPALLSGNPLKQTDHRIALYEILTLLYFHNSSPD
jgi:hypothetical protein